MRRVRCPAWALAWLLACLGVFAWLPARADTALSVYQSFRGSVNFTGTQVTLRAYGNSGNACTLVKNGTATATLSGIPNGATVLSAQLYWAASGSSVDSVVNMDGNNITARSTFTSATIGNGYNYFAAAADITAAVKTKGNNTYTFSGLSVNNGSPWCDSQGVVGGFAMVVVYSLSSEPFRMLNIYEGFQYFRYNGLTINLGNFNVPNPLPSNVTGRIGHITWEGDSTLSGGGESLLFNNSELTDSMNPSGNQFNSQSNINSDYNSYGIDFDAYTLTAATGVVPGSNTATTTYKTGQDLVLLSAEIVAMPYVANADLALSMTRTGDLTANSTASYSISVSNQGVDTEAGPVKVTDTLPSGLSLVSYAGSGWSCASAAGSNGATVVTCSHNGPLDPQATMTALTLNVTASASGNYTNTATVTGTTGDDNSGNNTATNTYTQSSNTYGYSAVFTRETCTSGQRIVVLASDTGCHTFIGPVTAGANGTNGVNATNIYITGVTVNSSGQQVASALSSSSTTVAIDFMTSCQPFNSSVSATYAGLTLDCQGTYKTANVTVSGNQTTASNVSTFFYPNVGRVTLTARYNNTVVGSVTFVSRPWDIRVRDVIRNSDKFYDPATNGVSPNYTRADTGFARAGDPFTLRLGALMANTSTSSPQWAPDFGKEQNATFQFLLDRFAVTAPQSTPVAALTSTSSLATVADVDRAMENAFVINSNFAPSTDSSAPAGAFDATISYFEAGNIAITPSLADYLGTGPVGNTPPDPPDPTIAKFWPSTRVIGRFYPDRFQTNVVQKFNCLAPMNCPAAYDATKPAWPVEGAVYSNQPFTLTVNAFGLLQDANRGPQPLALFQNVAGVRTVGVGAVSAPNSSTTLGGLGLVTPLPVSSGSSDFPKMTTSATMTLTTGFDASKRLANWTAPTFFYVRATMAETRAIAGGLTQTFNVTSIAPLSAQAGTTYEDGLLAVNGRLQVANAIGAEALRLPVGLTAQYWSGSAWLTNTNDSDSTVAANAPVNVTVPMFCTRAFAATASTASGNCKSGLVTAVNAGTAIRLNNGRGTLVLQQPSTPGRLNGTIDYQVSGGDAAATGAGAAASFLPSTLARASFGLYKAPVIYLREVY